MAAKLNWLALLLALVVVALWFFGGPNLGWTKDKVKYTEKDPVTEIEVDRFKKQWVPGVDFLGEGLGLSLALAGSSLFLRKRGHSTAPPQPPSPPPS